VAEVDAATIAEKAIGLFVEALARDDAYLDVGDWRYDAVIEKAKRAAIHEVVTGVVPLTDPAVPKPLWNRPPARDVGKGAQFRDTDERLYESDGDNWVILPSTEPERYAKNEVVYVPLSNHRALHGRVWQDDGGDYVEVVGMEPVTGIGMRLTRGGFGVGIDVPRKLLRLDRRGR
jgi:hypothetical protein